MPFKAPRSAGPACPDCGAAPAKRIGRLPDGNSFVGRRTEAPLPGGDLFRCGSCNLSFRWPQPDTTMTAALYEDTRVTVWSEPAAQRLEWQIIRSWVAGLAMPRPRVLDVGCNTGDLLASLGEDVAKYGVEPNRHARAAAAERCEETWASLDDIAAGTCFDVIVATDVLEHIAEPSRFVRRMFSLLAPGGRVILATGDADAPLARLARAHWWYWFLVEHVSFVSRAWYATLCRREELELLDVAQYAHGTLHGLARLRGLVLALAYAALGQRYLALLARLHRLLGREWPPTPQGRGVTRDHLIVALARPQAASSSSIHARRA